MKSSLLKFRSLIFTGCTCFLFGSHSQAFVIQAGLINPSLITASTRKKAAVTWLHVELRGGSRTPATSKMERFLISVAGSC